MMSNDPSSTGFGFWVWGSGFGVHGLRVRVEEQVWTLGLVVKGLRLGFGI